jgi:tetratricopeptide (TPR) repeat protein
LLLGPFPLTAQEHRHTADELGSVTFPVTCNAQAQARMNQAVAMLHSFWFPEARKTFESVVQADPKCGIAFWGVALTHFGNPMAGGNAPDQQALGWAAAQKAEQIGARSDRDRKYIEAALALFRDHDRVDNKTRMRAYEQAVKVVVDANPQDTEAKIFHGLFMVANAPATDLTFAQQKKAADILTGLFRQQPKHPGLAHYIIHAFDSPPLAQHALEAARQYAGIAPAAPHALHMPSHIFTRLGYWDESIKTNRRAADTETVLGGKAHPMDYMVYAYLQQGRDEAAEAVIKELGATVTGEYVTGAATAGYNALAMPARYALERNDWKTAAGLKLIASSPSVEAVTRFARGLGAARSGQAPAARAEVVAMQKLVTALNNQNDSYWAIVINAQSLAIDAWIAHVEGKGADALRIARQAAEQEEKVEKHPVTPGPLIPARELLGDLLLEHNQPAEALAAYEATLQREPNRARTLLGAARAGKAAGKNDVAKKFYGELIKLMDPASKRPELAEAKQFAAK